MGLIESHESLKVEDNQGREVRDPETHLLRDFEDGGRGPQGKRSSSL